MSFFAEFFPELLKGFIITLKVLVVAIPLSMILAVLLAVARVYGSKPVSLFASGFVGFFRGLPCLVTLLIIFFGLPKLGVYFSPYWSAVLGFVFCSSSYQSEYVRGAIRSIDVGQSYAARSLGMSKFREVIHIIFPQAYRRALPGLSNEIIYLIKYSSLAFIIGLGEMFSVGKHFLSLYMKPMIIFPTLAAIYIVMTTIATVGFWIVEGKLRVPGMK